MRRFYGEDAKPRRGVAPRPGFFPWHDAECNMEPRYEKVTMTEQLRAFWCRSHGQWCYERPVGVTWHWADGSKSEPPIRPRPYGSGLDTVDPGF